MFRSYGNTLRSFGIAASLAFFAASLLGQTRTPVVPNRIVQAIDDNSRVTLHGYVHPLANAANDRGPASDSTPLERMHLVLKRSASQEAALQQLVAGMHTPGDPNFHKWLTPDAFGKQFGPSDQDIATVESWLASQGFQVTGVKPGRQVMEFTGNVAQVRNAFHTQIHQYVVNGSTHFAAATDPQIPAAIAPVVGGFVSL
ncbi:MAG TPA: protease pro-enzyme activation domain-containing protein, partial [Acidobacteriaceae bacterium]|nr:protease pro-enzyme activation domain-containing protein [Acidobacteriaceae bacterium]